MCRKESFNAFAQREADRQIKALKVYCPNMKDGCGWTGELASIVGHKPHQKCRRCDKCNDIIHYSDTSSHLPTNCPCYCPHCDVTTDREVISSEHKEKCHRFPLRCPNNCGQNNIPRDNMNNHKKVCPLEMVLCKYQCGARIVRNAVEKHNQEKLKEHIELTRGVLRKLEAKQNLQSMLLLSTWSHFIIISIIMVLCTIIVGLLLQRSNSRDHAVCSTLDCFMYTCVR